MRFELKDYRPDWSCLSKVWNLVESPEFEQERKDFIPRPDFRALPKEGGEAVHFMR